MLSGKTLKNRILTGVLYCILIIIFCGNVVSYAKDSSYIQLAEDIIEGVLTNNIKASGAKDVKEYIDTVLPKGVGGSADWYVLSLYQYDDFDFSRYHIALEEYLKENDVKGATTRLKFSLLLAATGGSEYIEKCLEDDSVGGQGIMSYVYGLHLINNGFEGSIKFGTIIEKLSEMRHPDNGWSVTGDYGDVDVTAMVLQALAPHYDGTAKDYDSSWKPKIKELVENAVTFLSERQLGDGDFQSFGVRNAESTAQVITALSALKIDPASDKRFVKNGHSAFDGLMLYYLPDGTFSHKLNGDTNPTATVQSFYSMVAYVRMIDSKGSLFVLDEKDPVNSVEQTSEKPDKQSVEQTDKKNDVNEPDIKTDTTQEIIENGSVQEPEDVHKEESSGYKPYVIISILVLAAVACIILSLLKKHIKNHIFVLILAVIGILIVVFTDFSSADSYYKDTVQKDNVIGTVTMSIRCDILKGKSNDQHIPEDGCILDTSEFEIAKGDTAYDVLLSAAKKYGIRVEHEGSSDMAYISGINYLYEHDFGDLSGWVYKVNGEMPSVGCAGYVLKDKDIIEWCYTLDLGNDTMS